MSDWPLLSLVIFLPLLGAAFIPIVRGEPETVARNARAVALWTSLLTFVLSIFIWTGFDKGNPGFQFVERDDELLAAFVGSGLLAFMPPEVSGQRDQSDRDRHQQHLAIALEETLELVLAQRVVDFAQEYILLGLGFLAVALLRAVDGLGWEGQVGRLCLVTS